MDIKPLQIPDRYFGQPIPVAPDMNEVVDKVDELVAAVNAGLATSNAIVGGPKYVQYRASQLYGVPVEALTLDRLDPATILPGTMATVINSADNPLGATAPSTQYVATIVPAGTAGAVQVPAYTGAPVKVWIAWQQVTSADSFTPFLASELASGKKDYADKPLREVVLKLINALNTNVTTVTTPADVAAPKAPTAGLVDDTADTFSGVLVPGYLALADYEVFGVPGFLGIVSAAVAGCDVQGGRLILRGLTGPLGVGTVGMRVAASGNRPAGASLTNAVAFTGVTTTTPTTPTTPVPTALTAGLAIAVASIMAGNPLTFTVTAGGGAGGYSYSVVATSTTTGTSINIGSAASGSWTPTRADDYAITATVTDAAGSAKTSPVRGLHVSGAPLANAGSDTVLTQPASSATLQGSGYEQNYAGQYTYSWSQSPGDPANVTFSSKTAAQPTVSGLTAVGAYHFQLIVTDTAGNVSLADEVVVTVQAAASSGAKPVVLLMLTNSRGVYSFAADGSHVTPHSCNVDTAPTTRIIDRVNDRFIKPTGLEAAVCLGYAGKDLSAWLTQKYDPEVLADYGAEYQAFKAKYPASQFDVRIFILNYENAPYLRLPADIDADYVRTINFLNADGYTDISLAAPVLRTDRTYTQDNTYTYDRNLFRTTWSDPAHQAQYGYSYVEDSVAPEMVADDYATSQFCCGDGVHDSALGIIHTARQVIAGFSRRPGANFTAETSSAATVSSLAISGPASVPEGSTAVYTAIATYSDNTTQDVSNLAAFSITEGNFSGHTLTEASNATTGDTRQATITGSYGGKTATKAITITDATSTGGGTTVPSGPQAADFLRVNENGELQPDGYTVKGKDGIAQFSCIAETKKALVRYGRLRARINNADVGTIFASASTPSTTGKWKDDEATFYFDGNGSNDVYSFGQPLGGEDSRTTTGSNVDFDYTPHASDNTLDMCQVYIDNVAEGPAFAVPTGHHFLRLRLSAGITATCFYVSGALIDNV